MLLFTIQFFLYICAEKSYIQIETLRVVIKRNGYKALFVLTMIYIASCLSACRYIKEIGGNNDAADRERVSRLVAIDDSISLLSPSVEDTIKAGMKNATDTLQWCEYSVRLCRYYFKTNKSDSMNVYLNKVMAYAQKQQPSQRVNGVLGLAYECEAGIKQLTQRGGREVIDLHRKAYYKILDSEIKSSISDIVANLGDAYYLGGNIPKAALCYRKALFLVDSLRLPKEKNITLYTGLARIYEQLGDLSEAERFYRESEKNLGRMQANMQVYFLSSIGSYYYKIRQYQRSLGYFKRMYRVVEKSEGDTGFNMALCRINTADVYLNLGDIKQAENYLNLSEPYFRRNNIGVGIHYGNSIRMGILLKQKKYKEIQRILSNEHIDGFIDYPIQKIRNAYLRDYYVATGNPAAALRNKIREDEADDSIARSNSYMRASEIIQRFSEDTLALHHDIAMAEKEKKEQQDQNMIIILSAGILVMALGFVVWWMYIRKKQVSAQMERFMLRLENTRNRISPHFIFNVLNNRIYTAGQKEKDELMSLAQLIRKSLDISRTTFVTLEEELDFVKKYVEVQSYILRPDFEFKLTLPDDISGIYIPSMSVQILAENAIKHGLKGLDRKQMLSINVSKQEKTVEIAVEDNGRGFDCTKGSGNGLGMNIIRQTIAAVNRRSKRGKMDLDIMNTHDSEGRISGCRITMTINGKINIQKL